MIPAPIYMTMSYIICARLNNTGNKVQFISTRDQYDPYKMIQNDSNVPNVFTLIKYINTNLGK